MPPRRASNPPRRNSAGVLVTVDAQDGNSSDSSEISLTSTVESEQQAEYNVECIVCEEVRNNKIHYLVKWEGYPPERNTWETRESFISPLPLDAWDTEKSRILKGRSTAFDLDKWLENQDEIKREKAERKRKRAKRRQRLKKLEGNEEHDEHEDGDEERGEEKNDEGNADDEDEEQADEDDDEQGEPLSAPTTQHQGAPPPQPQNARPERARVQGSHFHFSQPATYNIQHTTQPFPQPRRPKSGRFIEVSANDPNTRQKVPTMTEIVRQQNRSRPSPPLGKTQMEYYSKNRFFDPRIGPPPLPPPLPPLVPPTAPATASTFINDTFKEVARSRKERDRTDRRRHDSSPDQTGSIQPDEKDERNGSDHVRMDTSTTDAPRPPPHTTFTCYFWFFHKKGWGSKECTKGKDCRYAHQFTGAVLDVNTKKVAMGSTPDDIHQKQFMCWKYLSRRGCLNRDCPFSHELPDVSGTDVPAPLPRDVSLGIGAKFGMLSVCPPGTASLHSDTTSSMGANLGTPSAYPPDTFTPHANPASHVMSNSPTPNNPVNAKFAEGIAGKGSNLFMTDVSHLFDWEGTRSLKRNVMIISPNDSPAHRREIKLITGVFLSHGADVYHFHVQDTWEYWLRHIEEGVFCLHPEIADGFFHIPGLWRLINGRGGRKFNFFEVGRNTFPDSWSNLYQPGAGASGVLYCHRQLFCRGQCFFILDELIEDFPARTSAFIDAFLTRQSARTSAERECYKIVARPGVLNFANALTAKYTDKTERLKLQEKFELLVCDDLNDTARYCRNVVDDMLTGQMDSTGGSGCHLISPRTCDSEHMDHMEWVEGAWNRDRKQATGEVVSWFALFALGHMEEFRNFIVVCGPNYTDGIRDLGYTNMLEFMTPEAAAQRVLA